MKSCIVIATLIAVTATALAGEAVPEAKPPKGEPAVQDDTKAAIPPSTSGKDVVGKPLPIASLRWIAGGEHWADAQKPKATLVRWWTNACPYCEASLPVLEALQEEFGDRGLQCAAVYHPKPPRDVPDRQIQETATDLGFTGPLAVDPAWDFLKEHYLDTGRRHATSVSFLLDETGTIRFVHGGPVIGTSGEFADEYQNLRQAIMALLKVDEKGPRF